MNYLLQELINMIMLRTAPFHIRLGQYDLHSTIYVGETSYYVCFYIQVEINSSSHEFFF